MYLCYYNLNMKKMYIIFLIIIVLIYIIYTNWLNVKLNWFINDKNADVGIAIIKNKKEWIIGSRDSLPMLSVFKYFVALKVLDKLEKEKISLNKEIIISKNMVDKNLYSPMLDEYTSFPFNISIANLLVYMISTSDNNACDILIDYVGGIEEIQNFVHSIGFFDVKISETEIEMNKNIEKQYLNKAYPIDIIRAMKFVREGNILSDDSREFLDEIMVNTITGKNKLKAGLPQNIELAHKTGSSSRTSNGIKIADNDAGYIFLPDGNVYYIAVMIKDSKMSDEENAKLINDVSRMVYTYFSCFTIAK